MSRAGAKIFAAGMAITLLAGAVAAIEPAAAWCRETFYGEPLRRAGVPPYDGHQAKIYAIAMEFEEPGIDRLGDYPTLNWADERIVEGFATNPQRARAMLLHVFTGFLTKADFNPNTGRLLKPGARKALHAMCTSTIRDGPFAIPSGPAILGAVIAQQSGIATNQDDARDLSCGGLLMADARAAQAEADRCLMLNEAAANEAAARGDMDAVNNGIVSRC